ncbi:MAG TPA: hypothetical protein IAC15_10545 [Candidatus Onthomonas avicola]|nr:hypothetical protein [Candidatus Onthomonas avicola]
MNIHVASVKVMNGLMPGSEFVTPMTLAERIVVAVDVVAAILIAGLGWFIWRGFHRKTAKQPEK